MRAESYYFYSLSRPLIINNHYIKVTNLSTLKHYIQHTLLFQSFLLIFNILFSLWHETCFCDAYLPTNFFSFFVALLINLNPCWCISHQPSPLLIHFHQPTPLLMHFSQATYLWDTLLYYKWYTFHHPPVNGIYTSY